VTDLAFNQEILSTRERWYLRAACQGVDTRQFFPPKGTHLPPDVAKICAGCEVRAECLEHAMVFYEIGVWGGTSEEERRQLRRERAGRPRQQAKAHVVVEPKPASPGPPGWVWGPDGWIAPKAAS
jgi:WhiB family redox-sensing transcriptional regulator